MACDVNTLEALAVVSDKYNGLSDRDRKVCLAYVYGNNAGFADANAVLTTAYSNKLSSLSHADLRKCLEAALC